MRQTMTANPRRLKRIGMRAGFLFRFKCLALFGCQQPDDIKTPQADSCRVAERTPTFQTPIQQQEPAMSLGISVPVTLIQASSTPATALWRQSLRLRDRGTEALRRVYPGILGEW